MNRRLLGLGILFLCAALNAQAIDTRTISPVREDHLREIQSLLRETGLREASVAFDAERRVTLKGIYRNRREVDLAFSIAQTVVGVKWTSPVTPENILVKDWEKHIGNALNQLATRGGRSSRDDSSHRSQVEPGRVQNKYALIVGVGRFAEKRINTLQYAAKDARSFYAHLVSANGGGFPKENVSLLTDAGATKASIQSALDTVLARAQEDDLVVVYFSSHGSPPDVDGLVNVVTYDTVVKPRHEIWSTSINGDLLGSFIQNLRAKRLVVILDTCYSSGAYKRVQGFLPTGDKALGLDDEATGLSREALAKLVGGKDLVLDLDADEPETTSRAGWGKVLISASAHDERSWESDRLKQGFFTYYFLEGLGKYGDVKESFRYAKPRVAQAVYREKKERQTPQAVASHADWAIEVR